MELFYGKSLDLKFVPDNLKAYLTFLEKNNGKKLVVRMQRETGVRSSAQNNAMHLYFKLMSDALNDGGFPLKYKLGDREIELDWTVRLFKENVWRIIQKALLGKNSTKDLNKIEDINVVYEHLNRFFSAKPFFIHVPFPKEEEIKSNIAYPNEDNKTAFD